MKIQSKQHGEKLVYFDAEFLPEVSPYQWYAPKKGNTFYCARNTKQNGIQTTLYVHQVVYIFVNQDLSQTTLTGID
jgi:hypothetical protein